MKRVITVLAVALALVGCGSADPINRELGDPRQAAKGMELNWLVARMTDQLMERKSLTTLTEPIAVASFVDLDTLKDTNWMGQQIEESFIYELNRRGEVVVDFKTTGNIQVTPQGDFVMSRNYKDLVPAAHLPHPDRHLQPQSAGDPGQRPHHRSAHQDGGDHGPEPDPETIFVRCQQLLWPGLHQSRLPDAGGPEPVRSSGQPDPLRWRVMKREAGWLILSRDTSGVVNRKTGKQR